MSASCVSLHEILMEDRGGLASDRRAVDDSSENVTFCRREVRDPKGDGDAGTRVETDSSAQNVTGNGDGTGGFINDAVELCETFVIKTDRIATMQRLLKCAGLNRVSLSVVEVWRL